MFQNFFNKHNSDFNNKIPKLMETGYLKLDYLRKKIKISNSSLLKEINYLGNSKNRIKEIINEILVKKNNREKI